MKPGCSRREFLAASAACVVSDVVSAFSRTVAVAAGRSDLAGLSLKKASDLLRTKAVSPVELTQACLSRVERYNRALNAFITVVPDEALAMAREIERQLQRGRWQGPLHGMPIALKDNIDTAGVRSTGASELFKDRIPSEDAEVARRLREAGAILLGKLNLHEFAYGGSSTVTHFGTMHNPWSLDRATGGRGRSLFWIARHRHGRISSRRGSGSGSRAGRSTTVWIRTSPKPWTTRSTSCASYCRGEGRRAAGYAECRDHLDAGSLSVPRRVDCRVARKVSTEHPRLAAARRRRESG